MVVQSVIPTYILTRAGLQPTPYQVATLNEAVQHEPLGVYTAARTFRGSYALLLDAHLDRLEQSAQLAGIPLNLDRAHLRAGLREVLALAGYPDAKFRITVPSDDPEKTYLALEIYHPVPADVREHGARVKVVPLVRANPIVKTSEWLVTRGPTQQDLPPEFYEGILVSEQGALLEGLSSNFYGVLDGVLYTAGSGVLEGITRRAVLEALEGLLPVRMEPVRLEDLPRLTEAMITSSGRGVVPVTAFDGQTIGDGQVGPIVREIRRRYEAWTDAHIEPI